MLLSDFFEARREKRIAAAAAEAKAEGKAEVYREIAAFENKFTFLQFTILAVM